MILLQLLLRIALGAILFRGRGGVFNAVACRLAGKNAERTVLVSDTEARLIYALLMVTLQFDQMTLPELGAVAVALFVGTLPPWPLVPTDSSREAYWKYFAALSLRGLWFTAPAGAVLWTFGYGAWYGLVGLMMAVCYLIASLIPSRIPMLRQGRELGEATFGGAQGLAFALI
jgi:hypothetical protein